MPRSLVEAANRLKRAPGVHAAYARVMGLVEDRQGARTARRYERAGARAGLTALTDAAVEVAVRQRLLARGVQPKPRKKGELHVFLAYAHVNWESVLPVALAPYGRVTTFEWRSRGYDERAPGWLERRDAMNAEMLAAFEQAHLEQPVDAFIGYLSGRNTSRRTVEAIARAGAVVFNFSWDDRLNFPGATLGGRHTSPAEIAGAVDLNLTNAPDSFLRYAVHGGLALFWPLAGEASIHRPLPRDFEFDVSFVGQRYGARPLFLERLRRRGIEVATFGEGWPGQRLSQDEMVALYSRSRVNLGFAGIHYCRRLMNLKGRDFEVPLSGGLYLTEEHPALHRVFDVGREILSYRDVRDCATTIRWLLEHPDEAARIRAAGYERARRDHTWAARFDAIFRLAGILGS